MELKAHFMYKSHMTYFHTLFPVYFYGLPNGKIVCMYANLSGNEDNQSGLVFVLAEHQDFIYDYHTGAIYIRGFKKISLEEFKDYVDKPEQRTVPLKRNNDFQSYSEALEFLNYGAKSMMNSFTVKDIIF